MQLNPSEISELIKSRIQNLDTSSQVRTQGTVVSVTDGICRVHGLADAMQGEMLEFPPTANGEATFGLALPGEIILIHVTGLGRISFHAGMGGRAAQRRRLRLPALSEPAQHG